jgi:hypothetical protein
MFERRFDSPALQAGIGGGALNTSGLKMAGLRFISPLQGLI